MTHLVLPLGDEYKLECVVFAKYFVVAYDVQVFVREIRQTRLDVLLQVSDGHVTRA